MTIGDIPPRHEQESRLFEDVEIKLRSAVDRFGVEGDQEKEPGLICRAGFLQVGGYMPFATSSVYVLSAWVDMQNYGKSVAYQIDDASHLVVGKYTTIVDKFSDERTLEDVLKYIVPCLNDERNQAYNDQANADIVLSLRDPVAYNQKLADMKKPRRRRLRSERRELEQVYASSGIEPPVAGFLARYAIQRRYK